MDYVVTNVLVGVVCTLFITGFGISITGLVRIYLAGKQTKGEWN